jgi:hypothetical protein
LTWDQVKAWRVRRHFLDRRAPKARGLEVAGAIGGLHAQLLSSAELSLWARVDGLAAGAVERALWEERTLVKTWAMRGTLHLLPAAEYPLWQAALGTYRHYLQASWFRYFGLTRDELERFLGAVAEALDGPPLTREALAGRVAEITGSAAFGEKVRGSWGSVLKPAAFRGQLCFGPGEGARVRFTRPDRWLGSRQAEDPETAVDAITRRFLSAYGPATREDYARWWGLQPAEAQARLKRLGDAVTPVEVEGAAAWMLAADVPEIALAAPGGAVRLLPAFDPYVIGATRGAPALLPDTHRARVYRAQGWISPVLLVDGRMDGVWRHEKKGTRLSVTIEPFANLPDATRRAAEAEAERLATFLGGALDLTWAV